MAKKEKPEVHLVFIGHIDHGKSTLVGRLLVDTGKVSQKKVDRLEKEAREYNKATFGLAYIMDDLPEERKRGVTIRSQIGSFSSPFQDYRISDAPGHQDYVDNMIRGTRQADAGVLVVNVNKGLQPQTREHIILAKTFGLDQIVVAMNQMDKTFPPFSKQCYEKVHSDIEGLLQQVGFKESQYSFVPVSAFNGDNVVRLSRNMNWYDGGTLLQNLDKLNSRQKPTNLPLRWPIHDVMKVKDRYIPVGFIATGIMRIGDEITFMPSNRSAYIKTMECERKRIDVATPGIPTGADIGLIGNAWEKQKEIKDGYVAGPRSSPPTVAKTFEAEIAIFNHPTQIFIGYSPKLNLHESKTQCAIISMRNKKNMHTGQITEDNPVYLQNGDLATVTFKPNVPVVVETEKEFGRFGRFAIRDSFGTVGAGKVLSVVRKEY